MHNVDPIVEQLEHLDFDFEDFKKTPPDAVGLQKMKDSGPRDFLKAIAAETYIAYLLQADSLTMADVLRYLPDDLKEEKTKMLKEAPEYALFVKDIFFDEEGNSTIIGKDEIQFRHFATALAVGYYGVGVTSERLLMQVEDILLADPARPSDIDLEGVLEAAYFAAESGQAIISKEAAAAWPASSTAQ